MAFHTDVTYTQSGSTNKNFTITFPFLETGDVKVNTKLSGSDTWVAKTADTEYTVSGKTLTFVTAPANNTTVNIYRNTNIDKTKVSFQTGASIRAQDLNNVSKQLLYAAQEYEQDGVVLTLPTGYPANKTNINLDSADSWSVVDGTIVTAKLNNLAVTNAKLANNAVTADKITADSINGTKIADDSIDSEHIVADSIDAEHYAPGSVDATAIASNAVTTAKILDDNVTYAKIQNIGTANRVLGRATTGEVQEVQVATDMVVDGAITQTKMASSRIFGSYAILQDTKTHNTHGQDLTLNAWNERDLNTEAIDPDGIIIGLNNKATSGNLKAASPNGTGGNYSVQPAANRFALGAGTYFIKWTSNFWRIDNVKTRFKDVTNSAVKAVSMNAFSQDSSGTASVNSIGWSRFVITGNTDYALEYFVKAEDSTTGGGYRSVEHDDQTEIEVYTTIEIYKEL